jgi:hypothetical protein
VQCFIIFDIVANQLRHLSSDNKEIMNIRLRSKHVN